MRFVRANALPSSGTLARDGAPKLFQEYYAFTYVFAGALLWPECRETHSYDARADE